ncbi:hypothetical protein J6590_039774, partial [Homalodisca vitripennis]
MLILTVVFYVASQGCRSALALSVASPRDEAILFNRMIKMIKIGSLTEHGPL